MALELVLHPSNSPRLLSRPLELFEIIQHFLWTESAIRTIERQFTNYVPTTKCTLQNCHQTTTRLLSNFLRTFLEPNRKTTQIKVPNSTQTIFILRPLFLSSLKSSDCKLTIIRLSSNYHRTIIELSSNYHRTIIELSSNFLRTIIELS